MHSKQTVIINTDGGSRGNPGKASYGFVVRKGNSIVHREGKQIGIATNNVAEYTAILESLRFVKANRQLIGDISGIEIRMDSLLACQQLRGKFKVTKSHLRKLLWEVKEVVAALSLPIEYVHVPREQNKEADEMVNLALDNTTS